MKKRLLLAAAAIAIMNLAGCGQTDSRVAAANLSTAADNFELNRRIVFYNGITADYILSIEGLCSKDDTSTERKLSITCKVGPNSFKRHLLGLSDNVTYFVEQLDAAPANVYRYRVVFKPSTILPEVDIR
ncbi:hypothetical protein [Cupriavidus metallidurans]|uniref:beta-sandwich lipoprotein n=1 Tax=Cupriavidus metallidurans TaxID=119219 RepID=UPI001CCD5F8B|nr:hypothetical protein [Cupriavidus metallidurans]UBM12821.1 hypothetical protein LAI70_28110 [Cupriavidus metallidurans]